MISEDFTNNYLTIEYSIDMKWREIFIEEINCMAYHLKKYGRDEDVIKDKRRMTRKEFDELKKREKRYDKLYMNRTKKLRKELDVLGEIRLRNLGLMNSY